MRITSSTAQRDRTPFFGRVRETERLQEELGRGVGLLTICGPSGMGKTRLARHVSARTTSLFESGGAWFCNLAAAQDVEDVEGAIARMLGVPGESGNDLSRAIANRGRMLLVLDNLDAVATRIDGVLGSWLDACPELQILATSILPIGMEGEARFNLGPLELSDAAELYRERARRAGAGRGFIEGDQPAVIELVGRLDRIPLAIELAAARVQVLPPQALLLRFDERFDLLRTGKGRHGSLLEALTLTWELLSEREQRALARASVFEQGCSFEAAIRVMGDGGAQGSSGGEDGDVAALLADLRSRALVHVEGSEDPRFYLLESVRDYAGQELRRTGRLAEAQERHASYFLERGEKEAARIGGPAEIEAVAWLQRERENLSAILLRDREERPTAAARAGLILSELIRATESFFAASLKAVESTLGAARASGDPRLLLRALREQEVALLVQGRIDEARELLDEALELARRLGDRAMEARLLVRLAKLSLRVDDVDAVELHSAQAVELAREAGEPVIEASALIERASGAGARDELVEAEGCMERAIVLLRRQGALRQEAIALVWMAAIWTMQGNFGKARRALLDALGRGRLLGDRSAAGYALASLGALELAAGCLDDAEAYCLEALVIERELGNLRLEGAVLGNLGIIALEQGDLARAEKQLGEGEALLAEAGDRRLRAEFAAFLAVVDARLGRIEEARRNLDELRAHFVEADHPSGLALPDALEGVLEVALARRFAPERFEEAQRLVDAAALRLHRARAPAAKKPSSLFEAIRILEQDLQAWSEDFVQVGQGAMHTKVLRIGPDAQWFELSGQKRVNLSRRVALRLLLDALVEKRLASPGEPLQPLELFEAGWPGVNIQPDAACNRVYIGIWTLRDFGLAAVILKQTDGYLLDPSVPVVRQEVAEATSA